MTKKGQKSHYDIKLLCGYGSGIFVKNQRLVLKSGIDVFTKEQEIEEYVPSSIPYSRIVMVGKAGYITNKAIQIFADYHVNVIFLDSFGTFKACINEVGSSYFASERRVAQYDTFRDPAKVLYLQKQLISAKLESQIEFVNDYFIKTKLRKFRNLVSKANSYRDIVNCEAHSGIIYRNHYASLFDPKYEYIQRSNRGRRSKQRYATNVINALLNYGFSVLYSEITKHINAQGLDPNYGFYHKNHESEQALVYDLAEPYRVLVESAVLEFSNTNLYWNRLHKCFKLDEKNHYQIILDDLTIRRFLETISRKFNEKKMYVSRYGNRGQRRQSVLTRESTILKLLTEKLALFCSCKVLKISFN